MSFFSRFFFVLFFLLLIMESYLKELAVLDKKSNSNVCIEIEFRDDILSLDTYDCNQYSESDQRLIIERFFYKYIDCMCEKPDSLLCNRVFDHLYAGNYYCLSLNVKSYLFESLDLCSPKFFLKWIDKKLNDEQEMSEINIQTFSNYVDAKRKRGLTHGEIRYALLCESSSTILELVLSKMYRDRLVSKHVWLAIFRLKQRLSLTNSQKDLFSDWLGIT